MAAIGNAGRIDLGEGDLADWGEPVGFVGLGDIGEPMARRLVAAGADVTVFDLRPEARAALAAAGAKVAANVAELSSQCSIVCIAVAYQSQVAEVVGDLLDFSRPGQLLVVHSTVQPSALADLSLRAAGRGVRLVDAPVTGGRPAAASGSLTLMLAGLPADIERCAPVFAALGTTAIFAGSAGNAQVLKLINHMLFQTHHLIVLEALRLAGAFDLEEAVVIEAMKASTARSWIVDNWGFLDRQVDRQVSAWGQAEMLKFMNVARNALTAGEMLGIPMPITAAAAQASAPLLLERLESLKHAAE